MGAAPGQGGAPHVKVFQRYEQPGWKETTIEKIKADHGVEPKVRDGRFYYIEVDGRDYIVCNEPVRCIFFDHVARSFLYLKIGNIQISEDCVFATENDAIDEVHALERSKEGHVSVYDMAGCLLKV